MNTQQLKKYAPQARRDFIAAVTARAALVGLSKKEVAPVTVQGDVAIIGGKPFPREVATRRARLEERIRREGFDQVMEAMAYTWFNRLMAIRFMELHGYLEHGYRVLSHPEGKPVPEILEHATEVELPGLDRDEVVDLKLDGTRDEELYRLLLLAQCHALHRAMPFLFEPVDDESELLLPTNLLHSDSLIRKLVEQVDEDLWQEIEIIGWIYQFYISEKKDQVIGKVVKSENIPAATQLFTPNWIVKYMVQNSLGAQWLATYPDSPLKGQMEYYIEPAEQTEEVKAQLAAITPSQLDPEELTLIDPACGSGHILVEAYELFKAMYLERGYRPRDVPQLILAKNLFGLDIDERAAQLAGFALMMKGRADDRRLFERGAQLNVMALVDSEEFDAEVLAKGVKLSDYGLKLGDLTELKSLFEHAKTFGSLTQVPEGLARKLPALKQLGESTSQNLFVSEALKRLARLVQQAGLLAAQYDAAVANPPYMGSKFYCPALKILVNTAFAEGKADLYGAFTLRNIILTKRGGRVGMITIPNWMFLSSFQSLRSIVLDSAPILNLVHNGRGVWGSDFGSCAYVLLRDGAADFRGAFLRLFDSQSSVVGNDELRKRFHTRKALVIANSAFKRIPGSPIAYWVSESVLRAFERSTLVGGLTDVRQGLATADNNRFLRMWWEPDIDSVGLNMNNIAEAQASGRKWFPYNKGGGFRRWYGNQEYVVNWEDDGREIRAFGTGSGGRPRSRAQNTEFYFRQSLSWSKVTIGGFALRQYQPGFIFDVAGCSIFGEGLTEILGCMNSAIMSQVVNSLSPTVNFEVGQVQAFPLIQPAGGSQRVCRLVDRLVDASRLDWDSAETSWNFQYLPLLSAAATSPTPTLESSYTAWTIRNRDTVAEMKRLEEENNRLFIDAYRLQDELIPDVPIEQITLTVNPAYRYGGHLTEEEQCTRFREDTMRELVSYAIGCMMGRYSLDEPGLIYAHSGNDGFDRSRYATFPADPDGIVPLTDAEWFADDAASRLVEFISVAWDAVHLEENLEFLAANLSPKKGESSRETLRRYLADSFFKDHLQTYKNRPIYWLFSSGREQAFQCLVYLHRYHDGTLARMRTEYVVPLQGLMASRLSQLEGDISKATSTAHRKKLERERDRLVKQRVELQEFDEKLRHYADLRIALDLDDGVKVNYGRFGDLLAEVKKVTGKEPE